MKNGSIRNPRRSRFTPTMAVVALVVLFVVPRNGHSQAKPFNVMEATVENIHAAYKSGQLTTHQLVQLYLDRIEAYDKKGPALNSIITVNPDALKEADRLDAAFKASGFVGPLHGIPVILKDMVDAKGMPTTEGSVLLKDFYPDKDAFVADKLKKAGAIILAKATLAEFATGDTYGSLFGATRNPYDLERTVGGSSGGNGASMAANFATLSIGQESGASIRRPSTWNSLVGMRPTPGLVSRTGVWGGWPTTVGTLGPITRTVEDLARLLDAMVGYDPEDPETALGVTNIPDTYTKSLDRNGLKGTRLGILRESIGQGSEPDSEDFKKVSEVFERALGELKAAGAELVDPIVIPNLKELLARRGGGGEDGNEAVRVYFGRNSNPMYRSYVDMAKSPLVNQVWPRARGRFTNATDAPPATPGSAQYYLARQELMINILKVMADNKLDAIVYKSVEHQPTLISDGMKPPYPSNKGVPSMNTFLVFVPAITVPAGFTRDNLPVGITFQGRPYSEATMIRLAYAYEQATHHRKPPQTVPDLE